MAAAGAMCSILVTDSSFPSNGMGYGGGTVGGNNLQPSYSNYDKLAEHHDR